MNGNALFLLTCIHTVMSCRAGQIFHPSTSLGSFGTSIQAAPCIHTRITHAHLFYLGQITLIPITQIFPSLGAIQYLPRSRFLINDFIKITPTVNNVKYFNSSNLCQPGIFRKLCIYNLDVFLKKYLFAKSKSNMLNGKSIMYDYKRKYFNTIGNFL